jgi:hypothetical protein
VDQCDYMNCYAMTLKLLSVLCVILFVRVIITKRIRQVGYLVYMGETCQYVQFCYKNLTGRDCLGDVVIGGGKMW